MLGRFTRQVGSGQRTQNPTRQWLSGFIVLVSYLGLLQKQRHWFCISIESRDHTLSSKVVEYFKFWFGFCLWWCSFFFFPRASLWYILSFFFFFWLHNATCGILVSQPGIEPVPPVLGAQSLEHWTPREVPGSDTLISWIWHAIRGKVSYMEPPSPHHPHQKSCASVYMTF